MWRIPNPDGRRLRIQSTSSHTEDISWGTGRQALPGLAPEGYLLLTAPSARHDKDWTPQSMPFCGINPEEKLRESIPDELKLGRLTYP